MFAHRRADEPAARSISSDPSDSTRTCNSAPAGEILPGTTETERIIRSPAWHRRSCKTGTRAGRLHHTHGVTGHCRRARRGADRVVLRQVKVGDQSVDDLELERRANVEPCLSAKWAEPGRSGCGFERPGGRRPDRDDPPAAGLVCLDQVSSPRLLPRTTRGGSGGPPGCRL